MSTTLAETVPIPPVAERLSMPPLAIWPDLIAACLFSLLGLTLSAVVLSWVSSETSSIMLAYTG